MDVKTDVLLSENEYDAKLAESTCDRTHRDGRRGKRQRATCNYFVILGDEFIVDMVITWNFVAQCMYNRYLIGHKKLKYHY